jgi:hypothetical protein
MLNYNTSKSHIKDTPMNPIKNCLKIGGKEEVGVEI